MKKIRFKGSIRLSVLTIILIGIAVAATVAITITMFVPAYNKSLLSDAEMSSEQAVSQTSVAINNYIDGMKSKLDKISEELENSNSIEEFFDKIAVTARIQTDIHSIIVYDSYGKLIETASDGLELKQDVYKNLSFDKNMFENTEDYVITSPHVQTIFKNSYPWVVTIAKKEADALFGKIKYIAIDFRFSEIAKYIDNIGMGRHGYCFIIDKEGDIVYHPQQQLIFVGIKNEETKNLVYYKDGINYENDTIYTINSTADKNWRIVGVSYTEDLTAEGATRIYYSVLGALLVSIIIAFVIMKFYSHVVNKPVYELVKAMKDFETSTKEFEYKEENITVREIKTLDESFEHMTSRIKALMEKVRKEEIVLRKTELKALQAQINPHFLYNTLDSIQWMCEQGKSEDAVKMVGALAKLFRISISRGHELITIKDELRHAENYFIIQSYRYRNQFEYEFNVDAGLENYLCNKITIQPLIENAIYHGIDRMVDEGKISVNVKDAGKDIIIEVEDNGIGMTAEQCKKILKKERSDSSGIGVKNVNDRLKIYFGDEYGLTIESELDVGTKVTVKIPKISEEPKNEV